MAPRRAAAMVAAAAMTVAMQHAHACAAFQIPPPRNAPRVGASSRGAAHDASSFVRYAAPSPFDAGSGGGGGPIPPPANPRGGMGSRMAPPAAVDAAVLSAVPVVDPRDAAALRGRDRFQQRLNQLRCVRVRVRVRTFVCVRESVCASTCVSVTVLRHGIRI